MKTYYVYILKCSDGSFYTGVTNNLELRLIQHEDGLIKKCYTYNKRPVKLVHFEEINEIYTAIAREKQIKGWSRRKKIALIKEDYDKLIEYSKSKKRHGSTSSP